MIKKRDMTQGVEWKAILMFSFPIMLGQFLQQLYNTVDGIVVGNFGGATEEACNNALAAVGGGMSLVFLFLAICIGLGNGGTVQIAQLYGANRYDEVRRAASTQIISMTLLGAVLAVVASVFARPLIVNLMKVIDPAVSDMAVTYFAIYSMGLVFQYAYNAVSGILRAVGDSHATLYFLIVSTIINTVLDLVFVISFGWGVAGVAIATVIAQAASALASFIYLFKKYDLFKYKKGEFAFDRDRFKVSLRLGIPAIIQQAVISMGNIFIQRLVNSFGTNLMNAFIVGNRMENYALVPIFGMNMGVSTFTGQNVGAMKFDRVRRGWKSAVIMAICASGCISAVMYVLAPSFSTLFGLSGEARSMAVEFQRFMSFALVLFAAQMPTSGTLQGAGDAVWTTISSIATLTTRVSCAYALVYLFDFGYSAVWVTMPIGWCVGIVITYSRFFSGKWKNKRIIHDDEQSVEIVENAVVSEEDL